MGNSTLDYEGWSQEEIQAQRDLYHYEKLDAAIWADVKMYAAPLGLLMNGIFLFVAIRVKSMHTTVNIYLGNLAAADSLVLTLGLALLVREDLNLSVMKATNFICLIASYCFITALAFERYFAVCKPLYFRATSSKARTVKVSVALWMIAAAGGTAWYFSPKFANATQTSANVNNLLLVVLYLTLLSINATLYTSIIKKLRRQQRLISSTARQRAGRVALMLLFNTAVFFSFNATSIAEGIYIVVINFSNMPKMQIIKALESWTDVHLAASILQLINSSINPLVYSWTNKSYRAAFVKAFPCFNLLSKCYRGSRDATRGKIWQIELHALSQRGYRIGGSQGN
ncbi:melanocortin receptor 5-like [Acanthaster planci]|uniref:Melanocortin receptor 5-like n=1 Tax=Acanthaster planci TaxID=133434 RepID=A0A8B7YW31_ACAPL|nr:melanocortin receptor 5-like [Acanthaster planci]